MSTRRTFLIQTAASVAAAANIRVAKAAAKDAAVTSRAPMKTYQVPHTDLVVSRIAYGSGYLGGENWSKDPVSADITAQATRLIQTAYDNGITFFDLADVYGYGASESAFGQALKNTPRLRNKIVVQSKCGIRWEDEPAGAPRRIDYSKEHIIESVEGSLRRIGTDRLDILLLHHPDPLMRPEEVAHAFDELKRSGKVRYFGVSNHSARQLELLRKYVRQPLVTNEVPIGLAHYNLITEDMDSTLGLLQIPRAASSSDETGTLDYCRLNHILVQAYSPLRGVPLGPLAPDATAQRKQLAQTLGEIAQRKNAAPAAVALAWLLAHPAGIIPITEPRNPAHLIENCTADNVDLTREEWYALLIAAAGVPPTKTSKPA